MERLSETTADLAAANIDALGELFPGAVTEALDADGQVIHAVNFDALRQMVADRVVEGPRERYQLDWPGKRAAMLAANAPTRSTLRPMLEESVDFENTKNIFIEGDNLEALKILQESYLGKVKLIYIDPPYNTGNDFIYNDDFAESNAEYLLRTEQSDQAGVKLIANTESRGRFHSDWLSMIYPRIKLSRNLLTSDGFIIVSIDDAEFAALKLVMDEVFGAANEIAVLVWDRNRKNDAKYFSIGHEYMLIYARDRAHLDSLGTRLKEPQPGLSEALAQFNELVRKHGDDWDAIQAAWRQHFNQFDAADERRKLGRFSKVGPRGPYRDDGNINWPGGGGPRYEVLHPVTNRPCKLPTSGWRYPTKARFDEMVDSRRVVFGPDETTVPRVVNYLFESDGLVMGSVHYSYAQTAAVDFQELMGGRVFDNPKPWKDLARLVEYLSGPDDLVLDFFAGSGSTGHAVLEVNARTGSQRRFILVQIAEEISAGIPAAQAGFSDIAALARERIRRSVTQLLTVYGDSELRDTGFRALKVASSTWMDVHLMPDGLDQQALDFLTENVKPDRSDNDLLFQVLVDWGLPLSLPITVERFEGEEVFVIDTGALVVCLAERLNIGLIRSIAQRQPMRSVFRDSSFSSDAERINLEQVFRELSPETQVKVI